MKGKYNFELVSQLSSDCEAHFYLLMVQGAIRYEDGNFFMHSKDDPYAEQPCTEVAAIEYAVFNYAIVTYKEKYKFIKK